MTQVTVQPNEIRTTVNPGRTTVVLETGHRGQSAYEIAVENGFTGTEEEWLQSLRGEGFRYVHPQSQPAAIWVIHHNLGGYPAVTVVDSAGTIVEGDTEYTDLNTITLTFVGPFSGQAFCS